MRISCNWLRELVALPAEATDDAIADRLTAAGLEVEGRTYLGAGLSGVIVAEVRGRKAHPKADKLGLVDVWDGREVTQVVCGAANVPAPGGKVAWARPGATLPGGITLAPKEVRGILSPGMLCAEDELGLSSDHAGILILDGSAAPGSDVAPLLGLPDTILELNVTPNRPDCLGHLGVARELCALFPGATLRDPGDAEKLDERGEPAARLATVRIDDAEGCPRYLARVISGVTVGVSPLHARLRLQALGIRAINDVVDATNLGLLETGHPLHAFDLDKLAGHAIVVRRPRHGETLVTLDGQARALAPDDVVICDAERPCAVAGVMGGRDSEVTTATTRILLESAHFDGRRVRRTGRRLGLSSEASQRFERGTDPNEGVARSSLRCAARIARSSGGQVAPGAIDVYPSPQEPKRVALRPARTELLLGIQLSAAEQARILSSLGLSRDGDGWRVPTFRPDLTREVDLIEEIARVHGYDQVPARLPAGELAPSPTDPISVAGEAVRDALAALGLAETISFAFVSPERLAQLELGGWRDQPLRLANPLREELSVLRTTLLPGLLQALQRNQAHSVSDVGLFEVGVVFRALPESPLPDEIPSLAGVMRGRRAGWLKPGEELDLFDVKGVIESLGARLRVAIELAPLEGGEARYLHPGVSAAITVAGRRAGVLGELHPALAEKLKLEGRTLIFELELAPFAAPPLPRMVDLPRFPTSSRDLSFFIDESVPSSALGALLASASPLVEAVRVLDDYREAGRVPEGQKGLLWSLTYRSRERTLTDEEVTEEHARVLAALTKRWPVTPR